MATDQRQRTRAPSALRVAVYGAGRWGALHAQKLSALADAELVALVDPDAGRGARVAQRLGVRWVPVLGRGEADAAVIAVPIEHLATAAEGALALGLHVLVEKPGGGSASAVEALSSAAERGGRQLAVGYLERFLPLPRTGRRLAAVRTGPGVAEQAWVADWMVHDLDHAVRLLGHGLEVVEARAHAGGVDVLLAGPGGRATLRSARGERARSLTVDGVAHTLLGGDPLTAELAAFCRAAAGGPRDGRLATGADAVAVLRLVAAIHRALDREAA